MRRESWFSVADDELSSYMVLENLINKMKEDILEYSHFGILVKKISVAVIIQDRRAFDD